MNRQQTTSDLISIETLEAFIGKGMSTNQIAQRLQLPQSTVCKYLRKYKLRTIYPHVGASRRRRRQSVPTLPISIRVPEAWLPIIDKIASRLKRSRNSIINDWVSEGMTRVKNQDRLQKRVERASDSIGETGRPASETTPQSSQAQPSGGARLGREASNRDLDQGRLP